MAEQSSGPEKRPWEPLKQAFLARLQNSASPALATEIWRLFADDRWFRQLLETRARRVITMRSARLAWLGDVMHEALLAFARRLARTPDLHVDLERVDETFPAWIGAIVERACGEAIQWLARLDRLQHGVLESIPDPRLEQAADARVDVNLAISEQEEPHRTLLWLSARGWSVQEIADQLDMTYWEVYRRLNAAVTRLQRRLADYQAEGSRAARAFPASSSSTMTRG
jgi:RNA polymerase sigma factor (sigma-70 family)